MTGQTENEQRTRETHDENRHNKNKTKRKRKRIVISEEEENSDEPITDLTNLTRHEQTKRKPKTARPNRALDEYFKPTRNKTPLHNIQTKKLTSTLPIPTITTYNVTSLSTYAKLGEPSHIRKMRITEDIIHLAKQADIILLQETKLDYYDRSTILEHKLPGWKLVYNNHPDNTHDPQHNRAGTLTLLSPHITQHYTLTEDKLPRKVRGHIQSIKLTGIPRDGSITPMPFRIINVYLATGAGLHKRRKKQMKALNTLPTDCHTFIGGDFNFVETHDDTTNFSAYHHLQPKTQKLWDTFINKHKLWEVPQPHHTQIALNQEEPRTSRIDRIYITHNEADCSLHTPQSHITNTPHSIIRTINNSHTADNTHIGTHAAVTLTFRTQTKTKHHKYKLPPWVTSTQAYQEIFRKEWEQIPATSCPFEQETQFKRTAKKAHRIFKNRKQELVTGEAENICLLTSAICLLRAMTTPQTGTCVPDLIRAKNPLVTQYSPTGSTDPNPLRGLISKLIEKGSPGAGLTASLREEGDRSEGEAIFRGVSKPSQPLDQVKTILPSTKMNLLSLRETISDTPTECPKQQANILKKFWGPIWAKRGNAPTTQEIENYLEEYDKIIPEHALPFIPSPDTVLEIIQKPKNTACGPDGLPFSLYRNLSDIATPILHKVIVRIAAGEAPPKEFNMGEVCFFPKDNSSTVARTRPITLNNVSNRIIASVVAKTIMPAVDAIVDRRQKGFVHGRRGEDNIHELTNLFYSKLNKQKQHYLLFIDTAKAFDSVDHDFLFAVLQKIGMPLWVIRFVRGLMTNVRVRPSLKGRTRTTIPIERGVKQGCPLSPLLFILAYDPLLQAINKIEGSTPWAFADDVVIAHPNMEGIKKITATIDQFSRLSGLGVNRDKSMILHTKKPKRKDKRALKEINWTGLNFTNKATYLGVLVGFNIDNVDIYYAAYVKFEKRAQKFTAALTHSTLQNRILIFNTYLLTLFSYISKFYILPHRELGDKIRLIIQRKIVSFNGGAYKYIHLITPSKNFGFAKPLRDLWATNVATLASQFDFSRLVESPEPIKGRHIAIVPGKTYINDSGPEWNGLIPEDHIICAALDIVNNIIPYKNNKYDITPLDVTRYKHQTKKLRQIIYNIALTEYDQDQSENLKVKLTRRNMYINPSKYFNPEQNFKQHGTNIVNTIPPYIRDHQRLLIFNALATDTRRAKAMHVPPRGPSTNPHPCFLCGKRTDSAAHIYGKCKPVRKARQIFGQRIGIKLKNNPKHYGLACKARTGNPDTPPRKKTDLARRTNATIIFNYIVWHTRRTYHMTKTRLPTQEQTITRIADNTTTLWNRHAPPHWRTTNDMTPPDPALLNPKGFGSASKRTPEQQREAKKYGELILASIPKTHHIAYTDGSVKLKVRDKLDKVGTNTGPCGAGIYLIYPQDRVPKTTLRISTAISEGTNNVGELFAIGEAIDAFIKTSNQGDRLTVLTDSRLATLLIEHNAKANSNKELVQAVRSKYWEARKHRKVRIRWIPAHVGITGNEIADKLADRGTTRAQQGHGMTKEELRTHIQQRTFHNPTNPKTDTARQTGCKRPRSDRDPQNDTGHKPPKRHMRTHNNA